MPSLAVCFLGHRATGSFLSDVALLVEQNAAEKRWHISSRKSCCRRQSLSPNAAQWGIVRDLGDVLCPFPVGMGEQRLLLKPVGARLA